MKASCRRQVLAVGPAEDPPVFEPVESRVRQLEVARGRKAATGSEPVNHLEHSAVREDQDLFAFMAARDLVDALRGPREKCAQALAGMEIELGAFGLEARVIGRQRRLCL